MVEILLWVCEGRRLCINKDDSLSVSENLFLSGNDA